MMIKLETKQEVTHKFMIGVGMIIASLIMGKIVLIPIILFPTNKQISLIMIIIYLITWPIMLTGIWLAGVEGYRLATHKYKKYKDKTVYHVKEGSKKAVHHVKEGSIKAVNHTRYAAKKTVETIKRPIKRSERTFRKVRNKRMRGL